MMDKDNPALGPYVREIDLARPLYQIKLIRRWDRESLIDGVYQTTSNSKPGSIH